ncbi:MAG TPA: adenylate kinase [Acidobacteriota bacterium]
MLIILLGAPGVGKGTQAQILVERHGWTRLATGDMLREAISAGTELGRKVQSVMARGELVSDAIIGELVEARLRGDAAAGGVVFDGFPRTVKQAELLERLLRESGRRLDQVIQIDLATEEIVRRISGRRSCPACGALYHLEDHPPQRAGRCDACGAELAQREDDRPEVVAERLREYHQHTAPLLEFYKQGFPFVAIDGRGTVDEVRRRIERVLESQA